VDTERVFGGDDIEIRILLDTLFSLYVGEHPENLLNRLAASCRHVLHGQMRLEQNMATGTGTMYQTQRRGSG
jgi:hypothetical protein